MHQFKKMLFGTTNSLVFVTNSMVFGVVCDEGLLVHFSSRSASFEILVIGIE